MPLNTNFNQDPYYDDFNDDKNFYRVLFKPGNAVQARELTQLQSTLQDQIKKFGDHIFRTGSVVTGGQITIQNTAYINISSTYSGQDISHINFDKQTIINTANTKRAYVLKSYGADSTNGEPITFVINQLYGAPFTENETVYTQNTDPAAITYYANTTATNATGNNQTFSVNEGVFYYDGFFVKTQPQSVAIAKYTSSGNALVGFAVSEDLIDYTEDTTLLDPAQGSSNFQAPGADRYKIALTLETRTVDSSDLKEFIEVAVMREGGLQKVIQTPIYGVIGDELARRTFDESGDYVIKNFDIFMSDSEANSAFANVTIGSGKAYIKGYEYQTISPTVLTIPKPRTVTEVQNQRITSDYGYFVYANNLIGNFATNQYDNVAVLSIDTGSIPTIASPTGIVNTAILANTTIGNVKVKMSKFYAASGNTQDANNYIYKLFITDSNSKSIGAEVNGGQGWNVDTAGTTSTVVLPGNFSANNDAYKGMKIKTTVIAGLTSGSGIDPYNLKQRTITAYVGSTRTATIDPPFTSAPQTSWRFIIDSGFFNAESLVRLNAAGYVIASANISPLSKNMSIGAPPAVLSDLQDQFQPTTIQEAKSEPLLIRIGFPNVADNTIKDFSYSYSKLYQDVVFTDTVSQALSFGTGESLQAATTDGSKRQYYRVVIKNPSSAPYYRGQTVPSQAITIGTDSRTITVSGGVTGMTANIYATINASNPTSKTKRFIKANTILVDPAGAGVRVNSIFTSGNDNVYVAADDGQTIIRDSILEKRTGRPQSLYVADVHSINAIFDFNGTWPITTANYNSTIANPSANVTDRYSFDTGQKDSYYDWSSISLKSGQNPPRGPLLIRYNRFKSTGAGFFNVDSYIRLGQESDGGSGVDYGSIPTYFTQDGKALKLAEYLDFRPVRKDAVGSFTANNFVLDADEANLGTKISEPDLDILTDYSYYLPRIDRVILTKNREFKILEGIPSTNPIVPAQPDDAMTLYILSHPSYLNFASSTQIQIFNNRRYTMKDIANLDKRIQNLELYTSLSLAELATINKNDRTVRDSIGLSRPKNGIFVDSFTDKRAADITATDFDAAIDIIARECRGSYNIASTGVFSNNSTSNFNVEVNGPLLLLASSNTTFVSQNKASKSLNINPFNVVNYLGSIKLDPPSDVWKSDNRLEAQNIDLTGGDAARDAWSSIQSTTWGAWNTQWTTSSTFLGSETSTETTNLRINGQTMDQVRAQRGDRIADIWENQFNRGGVGATGFVATADRTTTTTDRYHETQNLQASRTGILAQIVPQQLTQTLGDRVLDLSIVHYMREKNILVVAERFKPFTTLYAFFDNTKVAKYMAKVNRVQFETSPLEFQTTLSNAETVTIYQASSSDTFSETDTVIGTGGVVLTSNKDAYIVNFIPTPAFGSWSNVTNGIWVKGTVTGKTYHATKWYHSTGLALGGTASSITLNFHAGGAQGTADYVGQKIFILKGTGAGQEGIITAYDSSTRIATVSGFTVTPSTDSLYTIGLLETDEAGACAAVFNIPGDVFRTGEKLLRLVDDEFNNLENSRTNGDTTFYASGIVQTKQESSISVFSPTVTRRSVTEEFAASTDSVRSFTKSETTTVRAYVDPLAQTFLINIAQYPQGVVIDSIRVCFKTKDSTAPVTCQIRPVVNGYPSSSTVYPFGEKTLTPDKVKISTIPDITDPNKYTEFKFDVPLLLIPGEHSFVLLSNSNGYEAFIAGINDTDLRTSVKISDQPYTGSLFLSQNGSTWTADQYNDIMFTIQKRVFTNGVGYAYLESDMSQYSANTVYDVLQLMSTDVVIANTTVQYDFISELESGGTHPLLPIIPNIDYEVDIDGYGRRILNTVTGNTTFELRVSMATNNQDVSPMIDITRLNLLTIENKINNLPLKNTGFQITNSGVGYTGNGTVTFSYPNGAIGKGAGAAAVAVVENPGATGVISRIELTNPGTGYITSPLITINTPATGGGTTATVLYNGEDKSLGGNADVRYLTKRVPLASGFDAGDLRVYMDAYRPPGSGILVWYKLLSESDASKFEDNTWNLMTELSDSANFVSKNVYDYGELTFAPGVYGSGLADNKILYTSSQGTTHKDFMMFQIKVVMYGQSTTAVPRFGQLRVVALPASTLLGVVEGKVTTIPVN